MLSSDTETNSSGHLPESDHVPIIFGQFFRSQGCIYQQEYARNRQELVQAQKQGAQAEKSILQCAYQLIANYRWNLFVGCMLHLLQQFSGFTLVQYYGVQILRDAGFTDASNSLVLGCMVLVSVVMLVGNIVCIQVSERYGRRQLVLYCTMPMAVAMLGLTFCVAVNVFSETPGSFKLGGWIGLIALCVYMAFCSVGFATQPWTLCQEIFPAYLKNMAITITNLVSWACNYAIASWYLSMTDGQMGKCIMYSIMGISSLAAFGFCFRYLPETKDLPLDKAVEIRDTLGIERIMAAYYRTCYKFRQVSLTCSVCY